MGVKIAQSTMSPNLNTIEVYRGQSKDVQITITKDALDVDGLPIVEEFDLTGCSLYFTVRESAQNPKVIMSKSTAVGDELAIDAVPETGVAVIFLLPEDTNLLEPGLYFFDVWVEEPTGRRHPVVEPSEFKVVSAITRFDG